MAQRFNFPREQVFSDLGLIGAGYKLYTYETGTTTPLATYSDTALSVANTNPLIADSAGRFGDIFVNDLKLYKAVLKDADDNTIYTADPVDPKTFSLADFDPRPTSFWGTTAGTASAYTLDADPDVTAYSSTQTFFFACHLDCDASPTMAVDGLSALSLKKYDGTGSKVDLEATDMLSGSRYIATIDGTDIIIFNPEHPANLLADDSTFRGLTYLPKPITISNGTDADHDIDFTAGNFQFDDGSGQATLSAMTKQIDAAWSAGSGAGGLDTGTVAIDTWYHCYTINNPTAGVSDAIFTATYDGPTMPSGYTKRSYRGSVLTDGNANILGFTQSGNLFSWKSRINILDITTTAITKTPITVTGIPDVDAVGIYQASLVDGSSVFIRFFATQEDDSLPSASNNDLANTSSATRNNLEFIRQTTDSTIYYRSDSVTAVDEFQVYIRAYYNNSIKN